MSSTFVNSQITDAMTATPQNDMEILSRQILQASHAFTQTLAMENTVYQNQLDGIIRMTVGAMHNLVVLCKEATNIETASADFDQAIAKLKQQAVTDIQNVNNGQNNNTSAPLVNEKIPAQNTSGNDLGTTVSQYVAQSYANAVQAQQQVYITQQAAATELVSTLISITTTAVAVAVKNVESSTTPTT